MNYSLLALDLDGTLTNSRKEITPRSRRAIEAALGLGVSIILASGRPVLGIAPLAHDLGLFSRNAYILAYNGALLLSCETGEVVWQRTVGLEAIETVFSYARTHRLAALAYDEEGVITEMPDDPYIHKEAYNNSIPIRRVADLFAEVSLPQPKVMIVGEPSLLGPARQELQALLGDSADASFSEPCFMEITAKGVQKANSLDVLLSILGKRREALMVVGDGLNDVPMFQIAGLAVAMGNASLEVKSHAHVVTASNEEDGVALAIEKHILGL
ncbi:Cof-type HAD-IIB family hydrolase [Sphaerochaeta sp. PS]|uniref:Cof-type HAD-IIB family hydrolase n=1 Tax=Sphaerochaeta sp. PS TaxID=3076336 RepID=UPI0028A4F6B4|nr:Cof-type HAD-IIB family hydrolase [Sphaerochaeta sp. PS]MDT4763286.1 Cof-type HAD-IIB family hydrolase [Sphaerochaeta sp. PS]